jgi:hypothetical protein
VGRVGGAEEFVADGLEGHFGEWGIEIDLLDLLGEIGA